MPQDIRRRLALFRRPASFALVSHRNHRVEFRLAGRAYDLVSLPTYTPEQMKETIDRRLAWARRDPTESLQTIRVETVEQLMREHGSELAVLDYLYDRVERLVDEAVAGDFAGDWL